MKWPFASKYVRVLEEENARLREENRALLNAVLTTAGQAPIDFASADAKAQSAPKVGRRRSWFQIQRETEAASEKRILERARQGKGNADY
jgi:hypothetical protein